MRQITTLILFLLLGNGVYGELYIEERDGYKCTEIIKDTKRGLK